MKFDIIDEIKEIELIAKGSRIRDLTCLRRKPPTPVGG